MHAPLSSTPFWFDREITTSTPLSGHRHVDIAVVGGGYAGLSSALHLRSVSPSLSIALIDARHVGFGASGRCAGWLMALPPLPWLLNDLNDPETLDDVRHATRISMENIRALGDLVGKEKIDCDWTPTQHALAARNALETATIRWLAPRFAAAGMPSSLNERVGDLVGYPVQAALTYDIVTLQPYRLARGLRDYLLARGVTFYENTRVQRIERTQQGLRIESADGASLTAGKVILATNAYTSTIAIDHGERLPTPTHTYVIVTDPLTPDQIARISQTQIPFGDPALGFYIGRILPDNRLLFNGIDRKSAATMDDNAHQPSITRLHSEMIRRFPFLHDVPLTAAWGGPYQESQTDSAIVRTSSSDPDLILNFGYGGSSGISAALLSGRLTTDLILGDRSTDSDARRMRDLLAASHVSIMAPVRAATGVLRHLLTGSL